MSSWKNVLLSAVRLLNGAAVILLLALLLPGAALRSAGEWQNTEDPVLLGHILLTASEDMPGAGVQRNSLLLVHPEEEYPEKALLAARQAGKLYCGELVQKNMLGYILRVNDEQTGEVLFPTEELLGRVQVQIPQYGGWLRWAQTDRGLLTLVLLGVFFVEIPRLPGLVKKKPEQSAC